MSAIGNFVRLGRPRFLIGGLLGFALGAAVARFEGYPIAWPVYLLGQLMVTSFHLMVHYANDYFDRDADRLSNATLWSGGSGVLVSGLLPPAVALRAALTCAAIGAAAALAFAVRGATLTAALGAAIGVLAWCYSAPPVRFAARRLGELNTTLVVAILVPLAGYTVFAGRVDLRAVASALPAAAAMFVMMLCVEYPDAEADAAAGKRNLVSAGGPARARPLVYVGLVAIYAACAAAVAAGAASTLVVFGVLTLPLAWGLAERLALGDFGEPDADAEVAARGVTLFVAATAGSVLAYVAVL